MANTTIKDNVGLDDPRVLAILAEVRAEKIAALAYETISVEALGGLTLSLKDALAMYMPLKGTSAQLFRDEADREASVAVRTSREIHLWLKSLGVSLAFQDVFNLSQSL
jgi:hypothetical protein